MSRNPDRRQRIREILETSSDVSDLPGEDLSLLREIEELLTLDGYLEDSDGEPRHRPIPGPVDPPPKKPEEANLGRSIGPYRIIRQLGQGGMGAVYLAMREGEFEQQVALKLIHPGRTTQEILDRFLNERQILAHLQHPNIARLLDGGRTDDGLPYFVMEYVDGEPIDVYCKKRGLAVEARLRLFRQVCSAVHVAHQNLVVHRDIKPSNILITPGGVPKLLDFGIAKILAPDLASRDLETEVGRGPMTPDYASPEQMLGNVVTTASDVYSLGVLLYLLLAGRTPYRVAGSPHGEMIRVVCQEEPSKPSTTVGQMVAVGKSHRRLRRRLSGDLDAIVMKAMRKEPQHRYHSAEQLSDDIRRHLKGVPVLARQGTWVYLTSRYVRRHKLGLLVVLLIFGFAVSTTFLWREAVEGREQARRESDRSAHVVEFLQDLFLASNPNETEGREVTAREILDRSLDRIEEGLEGDIETQAYLLRVLGQVYNNLGIDETAWEIRRKTLELQQKINSANNPELATEVANLARMEYEFGDLGKAEGLYRLALQIRNKLGQDPVATTQTMDNLTNTLIRQGKYAEAEKIKRQVLDIRIRTLGESDIRVSWTNYGLAVIYYAQGDLEAAERILRQAFDAHVEKVGLEHTDTASIQGYLGVVLHELKLYEEAERALLSSLEVRRRFLGDSHRSVAVAQTRLASLYLSQGRTAEAENLLTQALAFFRDNLSEEQWPRVEAEGVYGSLLAASGRYGEAEPYLMRSYTLTQAIKGDDSTYTKIALRRLRNLEELMSKVGPGEKK